MAKIEIKQLDSGDLRYKVRFRLNGMQTSQTFDTEEEAAEFNQLAKDLGGWAQALSYLQTRGVAKTRQAMTLNRWFETFKETRSGIEERTIVDYQRQYDRHIKPTLGSLPLDMLDRVAIAGWVNTLAREGKVSSRGKKSGLSAKTIINLHGLLSAVLNEAVLDHKIQSNPCLATKLPRTNEIEREDARFLTHAEFARLEEATPEYWRPLLITLVGTGMRWSEATALRVGEVDFDGLPTIKIIRATKWTPGKGHDDGVPKSKKSRRTVIAPPQVVEAVSPLLVVKNRHERVFNKPDGERVINSWFHANVWAPARDAAELDTARIHDLRHTFASWALEMGIGLEAIQDQLGHESIMTTRKVYGHLQPAMREALFAAMGQALDVGRPPRAIES